jgi:2-iminoacetate synthase ThiH
MSVAELCRLVRDAGREPIQRDSVYNIVQRFDEPALA